MTNLQNELLRLLSESNNQQLNEASFDKINELIDELSDTKIQQTISDPLETLQAKCRNIISDMKDAVRYYKGVKDIADDVKAGTDVDVSLKKTMDRENRNIEQQKKKEDYEARLNKMEKDVKAASNNISKELEATKAELTAANEKLADMTNSGMADKNTIDSLNKKTTDLQNEIQQLQAKLKASEEKAAELEKQHAQVAAQPEAPAKKTRGRKTTAQPEQMAAESVMTEDLFGGIKSKYEDMKNASQNKKNVINQIHNASSKLTSVKGEIEEAKAIYIKVYAALNKMCKQIEQVQAEMEKKTSFMGRTFDFWDKKKK